LKKLSVVAGLIILFSGLILTSSSSYQYQVTGKEEIASISDTWSISGYFKKGENLTLEFTQHPDWRYLYYLEPEEGEPFYIKHFMVNITNVADNTYTLFKVVLMPPSGVIPGPPYTFMLYPSEIDVIHHSALIVEDQPEKIGGTVKSDGNHSIKCWLDPEYVMDNDPDTGEPWPHPASSPRKLTLHRVTAETMHPYGFLLPIGATTIAFGSVMFILGVRSKRRKTLRKALRLPDKV
jgi:hypothetical protein